MVLCPCVALFDYWLSVRGWESKEQWDTYTFLINLLVFVGFGTPMAYVFATDKVAGDADAWLCIAVLATAFLFTISDFWFWVIRGVAEKIPLAEWFPAIGGFPDILPWRLFGIQMTTNLHLLLVAAGTLFIFGGTYAFNKKYV